MGIGATLSQRAKSAPLSPLRLLRSYNFQGEIAQVGRIALALLRQFNDGFGNHRSQRVFPLQSVLRPLLFKGQPIGLLAGGRWEDGDALSMSLGISVR